MGQLEQPFKRNGIEFPKRQEDWFVEMATDRQYWRRLNPALSIEEIPRAVWKNDPFSAEDVQRYVDHFRHTGYFKTQPVFAATELDPALNCVEKLRRERWPAIFTFNPSMPTRGMRPRGLT